MLYTFLMRICLYLVRMHYSVRDMYDKLERGNQVPVI